VPPAPAGSLLAPLFVSGREGGTMDDPRRLRVAQAMEILGRSDWWVRNAVRNGTIPYIRVGKIIEFDEAELRAWLERQHHVPVEEAAS